MKLNDFSLSARIIAGALITVIVGAAALMYVENARDHEAYLSRQYIDLEGALNAEESRLNQTISTLRQDVLFLSNAPPVSGIVRAALNHGYDPRYGNTHKVWTERLEQIFSAFSKAHPDYYKIRFIGVADGGREIVRIDNRNGKMEITPPDRLQTKGDRDYFRATLEMYEGQVYFSRFNLNREWGAIERPYWPTLRATTPVFTPSGEIFGMVMINVDANKLLRPSVLRLSPNIQTYITNNDGQYLLHPEAQRVFTFELGSKDNIATDFPVLKKMFNPQAAAYMPPQTMATATGSALIAAKRLHVDSDDPSRSLLLAYVIPGSVLAQQLPKIPLKDIIGGFIAMLLISAGALYVLRRTFAPLASIAEAADRIAAGEQNIRLPHAGGGEIGSLTNAINAMLFRLSQREQEVLRTNAELEERVKKRTVELELVQRLTDSLLSRYKTLMLTSMDGIHIMDTQGNLVEANDAFCNMLGYTREEVLALNVADWEAQHFAEEFGGGFKNLIGKSASFETLHRRKDGTMVNVELSISGVEMEGLGLVFATSRDITERKRAETQTIKSLSLLHATLESTNDAILVVNPDSAWELYNQKFVDLWHIPDEITAARDDNAALSYVLNQLEDRDVFLNKVRELYATPEASSFDILEFEDGRIIERYSIPQRIDGEVVGRVWSFRDITERKRAEEELRIAASAFEIQEGMIITDANGVIQRVNKAFTRITGYTAEEVFGKTPRLLKSGRHDAVFYAAMWESIHRTGVWKGEIWNRRKSGEIYPEYHSITAVKGENGEVTHYVGATNDITERKRVEMALVESHKLLKTIIDTVPLRIFWKNKELRYLGCNPAFARDAGEASTRNVIGKDDTQLIWKEHAEQYCADDRQVLESGTPKLFYEEQQTMSDGRPIWLRISKVPLRDANNETMGVLGVYQDITENKQAEDALRVAAVAFETQEAILIADANANIIRVNRAFTEITGYGQEEVLGKNPRILSSGRQDKAFYAAMWQQLLNTGSWAGELWDRRKNGQVYPKWLSITAVKDAEEKTTGYVASFTDITERKKAEEEIHNLAFYDALTKLPNRRLFLDRFCTALTASVRHNNYGAVLFIDLDRFKLLNDTLGHDYGDLLLTEVAVRIKNCVREMDTVARLGGDEFVVLIESVSDDKEDASYKVGLIAEKIRESLAAPYNLKGHEHRSSPSIGVSLYRGNEEPVEKLLQHADMAMYQAKESGRNAVRFFDTAMQNNVAIRAELLQDLHNAIAQQQFHLYYQLQLDVDNQPVGAEALLRWIHPQRGMVMPEQFLPIAEESTLIIDIDDWVLERASRQLALWGANEKMRDLVLTVNVSAKQFALPDFVDKIAGALGTHRINPPRLKLELTENMAFDDLPGAVEKMHALKALGVCLSMDDFGTHYSSLSNLRKLPLDQLKLGRSFVQDVASDGNVALLVQSIIDLSSKCRISVIAEGVESEAQLAMLKDRDCVAYQGFLFSKAVPIEEFERLLDRA